jgi:hypothetical protein
MTFVRNTLFVSVNKSFESEENVGTSTLAELADCVRGDWALSASKAGQAEIVVAVYHAEPVGAWELKGAYPAHDPADEERPPGGEPWDLSSSPPRCRLSLGEPMALIPQYRDLPNLRRGVALVLDTRVVPHPPTG